MQDWPLLVSTILDHAHINHPEREIVTRTVEGPIHRYTYRDLHGRAKRCANALRRLGVREGEVVATLAWNTYRHLEAWYGIMGLGAVCHTLNPRLFTEQLVVYSHRSNVLHALAINMPDVLGLRARDVIMPIVPMFHANAWAITFAAPMAGAKLVLPGCKLDGASVHELLEAEGVTCSAAVPTVWLSLLQSLEVRGERLSTLERVVVGGAACPAVVMDKLEQQYGVRVVHSWGMTEMSTVGVMGNLKPEMEALPRAEQLAWKLKQGRVFYTVEMKITDDAGRELPRDGKTFGHLLVRGPAIASGYHKGEGGQVLDADGFFDTNDVATIDAQGFMQITDRSKDVIKSGGEWISSIEIENVAVGHPPARSRSARCAEQLRDHKLRSVT